MRGLFFLILAGCLCFSFAHASDPVEDNDPREVREKVAHAKETPVLDQLPTGGVNRNAGNSGAARLVTKLETLRGIETALPDFRRPKTVDLSETVVRIYDGGGNRFEERRVRFGSFPKDLILDIKHAERTTKESEALAIDPLLYSPILIDSCR